MLGKASCDKAGPPPPLGMGWVPALTIPLMTVRTQTWRQRVPGSMLLSSPCSSQADIVAMEQGRWDSRLCGSPGLSGTGHVWHLAQTCGWRSCRGHPEEDHHAASWTGPRGRWPSGCFFSCVVLSVLFINTSILFYSSRLFIQMLFISFNSKNRPQDHDLIFAYITK